MVATHVLRQIGGLPDLYFCTHCRARLLSGKFSLKASDRGFWCENCDEKSDSTLTEVVKLMRVFIKDSKNPHKLIVGDSTLKRVRITIGKILRTQGHTMR
jgi:DNA-directed RNA polymerase subunit RPC12/RpoP